MLVPTPPHASRLPSFAPNCGRLDTALKRLSLAPLRRGFFVRAASDFRHSNQRLGSPLNCACRAKFAELVSTTTPPLRNEYGASGKLPSSDAPDAGGPTLCNQPCGAALSRWACPPERLAGPVMTNMTQLSPAPSLWRGFCLGRALATKPQPRPLIGRACRSLSETVGRHTTFLGAPDRQATPP